MNNLTRAYGRYGGKDAFLRACRTKPASELLLCMMRAMIANSDRSDVSHDIERGPK